MSAMMDPELLWSQLLSGEPVRIRAAWKKLQAEEREHIRRHLHAMAEEEGWQPAQRRSALAALECLEEKREG